MKTCTIVGYRISSQLHFECVIEGDDVDITRTIINLLDDPEVLIIGIETVESEQS